MPTGVAVSVGAPTRFLISRPSDKELAALTEHSPQGEQPWMVIAPQGDAGFLAPFSSELIIVKTGGMTGFLAAGLAGARVGYFPYTHITGIDYHSSIAIGVLEILTPSYGPVGVTHPVQEEVLQESARVVGPVIARTLECHEADTATVGDPAKYRAARRTDQHK